jgi:capsular exopolysaccharide synthesis family protein
MSKLFREMQEVGTSATTDSANAVALTELLHTVHAETQATRAATSTPLLGCQSVNLLPMKRPILLSGDESTATHTAFESYRSLRTKITRLQSSQGIRSLAISSAIAGEGKTVSAINLAISLSQLETQRVLLVDGDIRTAGLSGVMGVTDKPGLSEFLQGKCQFTNGVLSTNLPRLYVVGAGALTSAASDLFSNTKWKEFIGWCNEIFDMVVVDCPPILGLADFDLISASTDGVMIVVRAHKTKRETLSDLGQHLQGKKVLGIILNGEEKRKNNYYGYHHYSRPRANDNKKS